MCFEMRSDHPVEATGNALMLGVRRSRHIVLPLNQLVPLPIVGEQQKVVVGELHA
jgi:hypothetical protein